jgi:hypothetical protein
MICIRLRRRGVMSIRRGTFVEDFETKWYCDEPANVFDAVHLKLFNDDMEAGQFFGHSDLCNIALVLRWRLCTKDRSVCGKKKVDN